MRRTDDIVTEAEQLFNGLLMEGHDEGLVSQVE